jgi:hypothetical protein
MDGLSLPDHGAGSQLLHVSAPTIWRKATSPCRPREWEAPGCCCDAGMFRTCHMPDAQCCCLPIFGTVNPPAAPSKRNAYSSALYSAATIIAVVVIRYSVTLPGEPDFKRRLTAVESLAFRARVDVQQIKSTEDVDVELEAAKQHGSPSVIDRLRAAGLALTITHIAAMRNRLVWLPRPAQSGSERSAFPIRARRIA